MRRNLGVLLLGGLVFGIGKANQQESTTGLTDPTWTDGLTAVGGLVAVVAVVLIAVDLIRSR